MVLKSLLFALLTFALAIVVSFVVVGIIKLLYMVIHKKEAPKAEAK